MKWIKKGTNQTSEQKNGVQIKTKQKSNIPVGNTISQQFPFIISEWNCTATVASIECTLYR